MGRDREEGRAHVGALVGHAEFYGRQRAGWGSEAKLGIDSHLLDLLLATSLFNAP